jgi:hypothetical protein
MKGEYAMKFLKTIGVLVTVVLLTVSCAGNSEKRRKDSDRNFSNQEWRRPPSHWGGP